MAQRPAGHRADRNRRAITRAAREVFLRDGYDASTDQIAAEAGVSKVTVYNHFGSKDQLFITVIGEAIESTLAGTLAEARRRLGAATDLDQLRDTLLWTVRAWVAETVAPDALALRYLVGRVERRFPELGRAWAERGPGRFHTIISDTFDRFVAGGALDIPRTDLAVRQLYALTLYPHFVAHDSGTALDPDITEQLVTVGVDMLLGYYSPAGHRP